MKNDEIKEILRKILICIYVLIVLVAINTVINISKNVTISSSSENTEKTEETGSTNTDYDVSMFKKVTPEEAVKAFDSDKLQVIYIGRETCGYCVQFLPTLQQAQKDYGYKTLYLDITTVTTEDQQNAIMKFDNDEKFLSQNFGATPMVLLVKDGKLVDGWVGYSEYDAFATFLEENGLEK